MIEYFWHHFDALHFTVNELGLLRIFSWSKWYPYQYLVRNKSISMIEITLDSVPIVSTIEQFLKIDFCRVNLRTQIGSNGFTDKEKCRVQYWHRVRPIFPSRSGKKFGPVSPELDFSQIFDNAWVTLICVDVWLGRPRSVRCKPIWIKAYHLKFSGCLFT